MDSRAGSRLNARVAYEERRMTAARTTPAIAAAAIAVACVALPAPAAAASACFTVYDRAGEIVYRDVASPFEGALDPASPGRTAMRARGEHLVFFEADFCPPVSRVVGLGSLGGRPPTTDEIVSGFPSVARGDQVRGAGGIAATMMTPTPWDAAPAFGGPAARITAPASNAVQMRTGSYR
jgi:hypothetical protein